ncbi:DNA repair protein [Rudanella paleaurantiibacter]|uniref:DNA repair protein n=1 Tax=Rudanella paleaurantiibacter TaxID=2614655 RepID=A0A7J5TVN7_9BACT|nr:CRISPR-associated endonuclease Cas6 [Rudanella paleaurantiibacter]KAB7728365.1 DNA repair protein [Rudanella paleaurantiibacter]
MPSTILLPLTTITFPEIALRTRDAHKLRGYFGELFREHSPLLHNHLEAEEGTADVKFRYAYPLVQYKVLNRVPTLVGAGEGAGLLAQLFLKIREIDIDRGSGQGERFPVLSKHIRHEQATLGISDDLLDYRFETRWMALNQANYRDYQRYSEAEREAQLKRILTSQLLATFREFGVWLEPTERVMVRLRTEEHTTQFKNQTMVVFSGGFTTNVVLPDGLGLGKAVSRGFGTILKSERVKE